MNRAWRFAIPCYILVAPLTIVGLLLALVVYRSWHFQIRDGIPTCIAGSFERSVTPKGPHERVTRIWGRPGAQTIGMLQIYANEHQRQRGDLRVHETVHVVQAFVFALGGLVVWPVLLAGSVGGILAALISLFGGGLVYALAYGVCFLVPFAIGGFKDWHTAYMKNPFEVQAYARQAEWLKMRPTDAVGIWGAR